MRTRLVLVVLCAAVLMSRPLEASQPNGTVAKLIRNQVIVGNLCSSSGFQSYSYFSPFEAVPPETFTLELSVIPFRSLETSFGLGDANGSEYVTLTFSNGRVNDLVYHRTKWNDVTAIVRPATQDYLLTVNGVQGGPYPFDPYCQQQGGCFTLQALSIYSSESNDEAVAWVDSILVTKDTASGREDLYSELFENCYQPLSVPIGGVLLAPQP